MFSGRMGDIQASFDSGRFRCRVAGVMLHEGHVLLGGDPDVPVWTLPGGALRWLESSDQGVAREMKEEVGVEVRVERLLWLYETISTSDGRPFHEIGFIYLVTPGDAPHLLDLGRSFRAVEGGPNPIELRWFPLDQLQHLPLLPIFLAGALQSIPERPQHVLDRAGL